MKGLLSKLKNRYLVIGIVVILALLGLVLRLNYINASAFWYDEAFTGILVRQDWGTLFTKIIEDRVHPPLYYVTLKIFTFILGNSDLVIRLFSLIFGILTIIFSYTLITKLFGRRTGLFTALFITFSPFFILYSIEARSYSMLVFEVLIAIYLFIKLNSKSYLNVKQLIKERDLTYLIIVSLALILTHYLSIFVLAPIYLIILFKVVPKSKNLFFIVILALFSLLLFNLAINGDTRFIPSSETHTKWLSQPLPQDLGEMFYMFLFGVETQSLGDQTFFRINGISDYTLIFSILLVTSLIVCIFQILKSKDEKLKSLSMLLLITSLFVLIASLFGVNLFLARYIIGLGVLYIIWVAVSLSRTNPFFYIPIILIYLLLLSQVKFQNWNRDYRELTSQVNEVSSEKRVVLESPFDFLTVKYYLNGSRKIYFLDNIQTRMYLGPWPFFERDEIVYNLQEGDYLVED